MTDKLTTPKLRRIVEKALTEDEKLLACLDSLSVWAADNAGKMLTKRNTPEGWIVRREYGMTHLETEAYYYGRFRTPEPKGPRASLLVAHQEANVYLPAAGDWGDLTMWRTRAAEAIERREALLADPAQLRAIVRALNAARAALAGIAEVLPWDVPDRHAMIEAAGLGDVKTGRLCL